MKKEEQKNPNLFIHSIHKTIDWLDVQQKAADAVVQVFSRIAKFNWLEPYKTPEQFIQFGSAFFISNEGYLLTNFHVVEETIGIQIQIPSLGKEQFDVEIVGVHPELDIALLQLKKDELVRVRSLLGEISFIELGDSDKIYRTQEVLALGYPLGQQSLKSTQGIVSGKEKFNMISYIQISAALNPGSSGGPALNSEGETIGISFAGVEIAQNVGYIIPINEIKSAIKGMQKLKLLRRPYFGGIFSISNQDMIDFLGNPPDGGFYIAKVFKDSLLEKGGAKEGDMLYAINEYAIDKYGEVSVDWSEDRISIFDLLNRYNLGDEIDFVIYRRGERKNLKFNLQITKTLPIRFKYPSFEEIDYEIIGGMVVMDLTLNHVSILSEIDPVFLKYMKADCQAYPKILITNIFHDSSAQRTRILEIGDIIAEVNEEVVNTLTDFRKAVQKSRQSGFLTIKTEDNIFSVMSLNKILDDEEFLSEKYFYKKSELIKMLWAR